MALVSQDFKCAITGKAVTMEECEAAHIVAHKNGGKTVFSNLAMVLKEHNQAMGTMNLDEYKKTYLSGSGI